MQEENMFNQIILNKGNIVEYIRDILPDRFNKEPKKIEELRGGIINTVHRVDFGNEKIILKQALTNAKSRYISCKINPERIIKEYEAISLFRKHAKLDELPQPIFIDKENYVMIVSSVPEPFKLLKESLINNIVDEEIAENIAKTLSRMHKSTMMRDEILFNFDNTENFINLKIKLQCLNITKENKIKKEIKKFINDSLKIRMVLLHGDIAPKNILVHNKKAYFIDFEESYYGDPALDIGYLLAHYFLNAINNNSLPLFYNAIDKIWEKYLQYINFKKEDIEKRLVKYIGIFLLSRIDGQAKADQIKREEIKHIIRKISKNIIMNNYKELEEIKEIIKKSAI